MSSKVDVSSIFNKNSILYGGKESTLGKNNGPDCLNGKGEDSSTVNGEVAQPNYINNNTFPDQNPIN